MPRVWSPPARGPRPRRAAVARARRRSRLRPRRVPAARARLHHPDEVRGVGRGRHAGPLHRAADLSRADALRVRPRRPRRARRARVDGERRARGGAPRAGRPAPRLDPRHLHLRRRVHVGAPPPPRDRLPRRLAARRAAARAAGPAPRLLLAHLHRAAREDRRAARAPAQDLPAQRRAQALVRGDAGGLAARHGDRGLARPLAPPPDARRLLRVPPDELPPGARRGRGRVRPVQPEVHAARPLRPGPPRGPRAHLRSADRAGTRGHARHGGAPVTDASEQPLRITPEMLLSRRVDFERRMRRFPPVTGVIIAVLVLVFAVELRLGALQSREAIVALGAPFLHGGVEHLVGNSIALFILGMVCEHAFGPGQFVVLYVLSGLAGSALSLVTSAGPSVGASGAIFGLQGAAIVLFRTHRERLLMRDRRIGFVLLVWALFTIAGGLMDPYIDNGAHIGGALGGALLARRLQPVVLSPLTPEQGARVRRGLWLGAALMAYAVWGWVRG